MFPSFELFGKEVSMYMICGVLGSVISGFIIYLLVRERNDLRKDQLLHIALAGFAGMFVGAHLLFGLTNLRKIIWVFQNFSVFMHSYKTVFYFLGDIFGGMVFYGGFFGALIGGYMYTKSLKLDFWTYLDAFVPAIPVMHAFGRIGCFLSGCCYGIESDFGFVYQNSLVAEANGVRRFPVQLLECTINLLVAIILVAIVKRGIEKKKILWIYCLLYSVERFGLEFLRGDVIRGIFFGISTSQWISMGLFVVSIIMLSATGKNRKNKKPAVENNNMQKEIPESILN